MIRRLLIANRGEIALRIIRSCRELGIDSVAVYSDADRRSPHTVAADRAEHIGPAPAPDSYLNVQALLDAAHRAGADAIHPGYGFLSERAHFSRACRDAGLIFVGPPPESLELMGSKIESRRLMQKADVPVVPGEVPASQTDAGIIEAVEHIGLPALIKPSAGGGGIGMKKVRDAADLTDAIQRARREAEAAFGNGTLYVERFIEGARHVEIQLIADSHGNIVHLFERECSVQRRHQKMVEESPCSALTAAVRHRMGVAAIAAARAAGYVNAGTIEFLLQQTEKEARFYFLEMNTRLQVEHPVTELVTGCDLVRAQLLVASGEPLPWTQEQLGQRGHAIECRVYAEDPSREFLPQAGTLLMYREPSGPGIRVDAGVVEGGEIPVFYDPLIAKLIVSAESREAAIARALAALRQYVVLGVRTNIPFLRAILRHPRFASADLDIAFLETEHAALLGAMDAQEFPLAGLAAAGLIGTLGGGSLERGAPTPTSRTAVDPFDTLSRWGLE